MVGQGLNTGILLPGILVPSATNTMAVTESLIPNVQPKCDATSPIIAVTTPIERIEITKHKYPPAMSAKRGSEKWLKQFYARTIRVWFAALVTS